MLLVAAGASGILISQVKKQALLLSKNENPELRHHTASQPIRTLRADAGQTLGERGGGVSQKGVVELPAEASANPEPSTWDPGSSGQSWLRPKQAPGKHGQAEGARDQTT